MLTFYITARPRVLRHYRMESLYAPENYVTATVLRDTTKKNIMYHTPIFHITSNWIIILLRAIWDTYNAGLQIAGIHQTWVHITFSISDFIDIYQVILQNYVNRHTKISPVSSVRVCNGFPTFRRIIVPWTLVSTRCENVDRTDRQRTIHRQGVTGSGLVVRKGRPMTVT